MGKDKIEVDVWWKMRKCERAVGRARSAEFANLRYKLTTLTKIDAVEEEEWMKMSGI